MNTRSENLKGPWDAPLKQFNNHFLVRVLVYDKEDKELFNAVIDYGNYEDRKFIGRISFWAYSNDYIVETFAEKK